MLHYLFIAQSQIHSFTYVNVFWEWQQTVEKKNFNESQQLDTGIGAWILLLRKDQDEESRLVKKQNEKIRTKTKI